MRFNLLLLVCLVFVGCAVPYHMKQAQKHQNKAVSKGATIERDTIAKTITKSDTITNIDTLNNTITITHTIRDTVYLEGSTQYIYKTRTEVRQEGKTERKKAKFKNNHDKKKLRIESKTERKTIKHKEKTKRKDAKGWSFWWLWLLIGVFIGIVIQKKILN